MTTPLVERIGRDAGQLRILVDGESTPCTPGETLAAAILSARDWIASDRVRRYGVYCGIGTCFECVVEVDGQAGIRACMTPAADGQRVVTDRKAAEGA